jgi:hypothetical protein
MLHAVPVQALPPTSQGARLSTQTGPSKQHLRWQEHGMREMRIGVSCLQTQHQQHVLDTFMLATLATPSLTDRQWNVQDQHLLHASAHCTLPALLIPQERSHSLRQLLLGH